MAGDFYFSIDIIEKLFYSVNTENNVNDPLSSTPKNPEQLQKHL
jgi:hypothetical protein